MSKNEQCREKAPAFFSADKKNKGLIYFFLFFLCEGKTTALSSTSTLWGLNVSAAVKRLFKCCQQGFQCSFGEALLLKRKRRVGPVQNDEQFISYLPV